MPEFNRFPLKAYALGLRILACAAASLAMGTRKGEQDTYVRPILLQNSMVEGSPPCSPQMPSLMSGRVCLPSSAAILTNLPTPVWSSLANGSLS